MPQFSDGQVIQGYTLTESRWQTDLGESWKVTDSQGASKLLTLFTGLEGLEGAPLDEMFTEFKRVLALDHPNVLRPEGFDTHAGVPFVLMPYSEQTLADEIRRRQSGAEAASGRMFSERECGELLLQVGSALEYIHGRILKHQDLNPNNIHVLQGSQSTQYAIADIGISAKAKQILHLSAGREQTASPYWAPEQTSGEPWKESDVFALGVILYQMLEGELPFHQPEDPPEYEPDWTRVPLLQSDVSNELKEFVRRCLDPDPHQRPQAYECTQLGRKLVEQNTDTTNTATQKPAQLTQTEQEPKIPAAGTTNTPTSGHESLTPKEQFEARHAGRAATNKKMAQIISQETLAPGPVQRPMRSGRPSIQLFAFITGIGLLIIALIWLVPKLGGKNVDKQHELALKAFENGNIQYAKSIWDAMGTKSTHETRKYAIICDRLQRKRYAGVRAFHNGRAAVRKKTGQWGFIDREGKEVIACTYDEVMDFTSPVTAVCVNGRCGFLDIDGKEMREMNFTMCRRTSANSWRVDSITASQAIRTNITFRGG